MNQASSLLRIAFGIIIVVLSILQYRAVNAAIDQGNKPQLFGQPLSVSPTLINVVIVLLGLAGLFLVIAGARNLLKR